MRKNNLKTIGQSLLEYTMLVIVIAAALTAMTTYIMRAMNAVLD